MITYFLLLFVGLVVSLIVLFVLIAVPYDNNGDNDQIL